MIDELIARFAKRAPVAVMFRSLFARVFSDQTLDALFSQHSVWQVESKLLFSALVKLLTPVVSGASHSVNASYQMSNCEVSSQAVYDKLKGVESEVSASLVRETVVELRRIQDKSKTLCDDVVPGYHTFVIDGKTYNGTEHRLKESREMPAHHCPAELSRCSIRVTSCLSMSNATATHIAVSGRSLNRCSNV